MKKLSSEGLCKGRRQDCRQIPSTNVKDSKCKVNKTPLLFLLMFDGLPVQGDGAQVEDTGGAAQHVRRQPDLAGDGAEYPPTED